MQKTFTMRWKRIAGLVGVMAFVVMLGSITASAEQMSSTNFQLNGNTNSAFGGQGTSTSYGMFSTGGEPVIGKGASGSYILGGGFTAQTERSIQLTVQPSGLLGFWDFDESTGSQYADSSVSQADAMKGGLNDDDISTTAGKIGNALTASGANDDSRIVMPAGSIQPSSITVELWARVNSWGIDSKWDSVCSYGAVVGEDWGPWELYTDGNNSSDTHVNLLWSIQNGSPLSITSSPANLALNTWYHIVGTYDATTGDSKLYVNGEREAWSTFSPGNLNYSVANTDDKISCFNSPRWPGEGIRGGVDQLKIFDRALTEEEVQTEYEAQNAGVPTGLTLSTVTPGASNTVLNDVIVRTDSAAYSVAISQDHNLQKGAVTIPGVGGTIASPAAWSEGTTKGLGFTLINAPGLESKWGSGANYAAIPGSATSFYTRSGHGDSGTIDVLNSRLRLDAAVSQETGSYSNTVTYTGTVLP